MKYTKITVIKEDGRYMTYFSFKNETEKTEQTEIQNTNAEEIRKEQ